VQVKIRQQQMLQLAGPARAHPSRLMKIMRAVSWWSRFRWRRDCRRWPQPDPGRPGGRVSIPYEGVLPWSGKPRQRSICGSAWKSRCTSPIA